MRILLTGGRIIDPSRKMDEVRDLLIEDDRIADLVPPGQSGDVTRQDRVIDVSGHLVLPGLIDMHVHLREPGEEYKETIATGTAAAAAGGFTAVAAMPNTKPVNDNRSVTEFILKQAREAGHCRVWPVAAMTGNLEGKELCEYAELSEAGARAVSDDGRWVADSDLMRRVLEYSRLFGLTAISHPEDVTLSSGGVMNEGVVSTRLGLPGMSTAAEEIAVCRDIILARLTGTPIHLAHVSTAGSVEIIRRAKSAGDPVTAETAPHYFCLTDEAVIGYRTNAKMNPPLRSRRDVEAVQAGLADGTIDTIATDHAPHSLLEKDVEFDQAAFGIIGLETALPLTLNLVRQGILTLSQAVTVMSLNPATILGIPGGTLRPGQPADVTVVDLEMEEIVDPNRFQSASRNTPFQGWALKGKAVLTITDGKIRHHLLPGKEHGQDPGCRR